ncbi:MAG: hypothetical protein J5961_04825 [Mogibacterium sp.]|nr:hypothetical protein [Mogibacterium sp.]
MKLISKHRFLATVILAAVILIAAVLVWAGISSRNSMADQTESIRDTIMSRALQCYVIEGAYPESLDYLKENYGLAVNTEDYRIVYIPYAENLPPEVKVIYLKDK